MSDASTTPGTRVEMVARAIAAFNSRDIATYDDLYTPDFAFFPALTGTIEGRSYRGREGLETWFVEARETWEEFRVLAEELRDLGDSVLGLGRIEGRGRVSGVELDAPMGIVVDFRDGRISRSRTYLDPGEAMRAAGVV
jgi:ketosteroid isomerase-like protein